MTKLYANRVLVTEKGHYAFRPALIEVHGSHIARVEVEPQHIDSDAIRFNDKIIIPAFVNAHTHLPMSAFRGLSSVVQQEGNVVEDVYFFNLSHVSLMKTSEHSLGLVPTNRCFKVSDSSGNIIMAGLHLRMGSMTPASKAWWHPRFRMFTVREPQFYKPNSKQPRLCAPRATHPRESLRRLDRMQPTRSVIRSGAILSAWLNPLNFHCTFIWPNLGKSMSETKPSTVNLPSSASIP